MPAPFRPNRCRCRDAGVGWFGYAPRRPVALTLALSRRAGEGDALLWAGDFCEEGDGCCGKGGVLSEPRITLFAQMGYDFWGSCDGFWFGGCGRLRRHEVGRLVEFEGH